MWQETSEYSRRSRSPTFSSLKKERSRSHSPHQCQIRRLYRAIEAIDTPHLDALRNRSPRSPVADKYRGTLGGCEPIMISQEKQVGVTVHEEKEVDSPVPMKAARLLGCYDDIAQRSSARKNRSGRIPLSKTEVRPSNWHLDQNLSVTPPDTPVERESFELEGDCSPLLLDTKPQAYSQSASVNSVALDTRKIDGAYIVELPGSPVFSSVSWAGENRHELPATPTEDWDQSLRPHPLRLSKSSICVLPSSCHSLRLQADVDDSRAARDGVQVDFKSSRDSQSTRRAQPRPMTICTPQSVLSDATVASTRSQGLRKVKARRDLRIPPPNLHKNNDVPIITVTNPTLEKSTQRSARAEKSREAGYATSPVVEDASREERKWEEITEAADLKLCMAVLTKEIARRKMEMRS